VRAERAPSSLASVKAMPGFPAAGAAKRAAGRLLAGAEGFHAGAAGFIANSFFGMGFGSTFFENLHLDLSLSELRGLANGRHVDIDHVPFDVSSTIDDRVIAGVCPGASDADLRAERQNVWVGSHGSFARFRPVGRFSLDRYRTWPNGDK